MCGHTSKKILKLHKEGKLTSEIAKKVGCSRVSVSRYTKPIKDKKRAEKVNKFKKNLNKLSESERGYIAGILDGEGSIIINLSTTKKKPNKKYYLASVVFGNQDKKIINYMYKKLELWTKIYQYKNKKDMIIKIFGKDIIPIFLNFILPYCHSKKTEKRGKIMLDFCKAKTHKEREKLYKKLRIYFNRKNIVNK